MNEEINELVETVPAIIKASLDKIKSKEKKEYTMNKFIDDTCKCWSKLTSEDQSLLSKLIAAEDFLKIIKELK